jgi:hypothetical protein
MILNYILTSRSSTPDFVLFTLIRTLTLKQLRCVTYEAPKKSGSGKAEAQHMSKLITVCLWAATLTSGA